MPFGAALDLEVLAIVRVAIRIAAEPRLLAALLRFLDLLAAFEEAMPAVAAALDHLLVLLDRALAALAVAIRVVHRALFLVLGRGGVRRVGVVDLLECFQRLVAVLPFG